MRRHAKGRRGGYVIVLLALMLFGLMAMAALVIDLGFARLTQRQMQTAVGSAALEGLRGEGGSSLTYEERQEAAERVIAWTFDDDLDATNGDDGIAGGGGAFGAGPLVAFSGGAGDPSLAASQLLSVDLNNTAYKPTLQRGEEVAGQFRVDLQRGGTQDGGDSLFSQGPAVPFLFARGSTLDRQLIANGITVSAASVARRAPALSVGLPVNDSSGVEVYPGAIAIGYRLDDWINARSDPRQIDAAKTAVGQQVVDQGAAVSLVDGYCCIFTTVTGTDTTDSDRVIGFGAIEDGTALSTFVAISNATGRLGDVWSEIEPEVRDAVLTENRRLTSGLFVPRLEN